MLAADEPWGPLGWSDPLLQQQQYAGGSGSYPPEETDLMTAGYRPYAPGVSVTLPPPLQALSNLVLAGDLKQKATRIVETYDSAFQQNLSLWQSGGVTTAQALAYFDSAWNQERAALSQLGEPGRRAIEERDRTYANGQGLRWDTMANFRDPIAQNAGMLDTFTARLSSLSFSPLIIAIVVVGVILLLKGRK